jgi:DNA-binding MarR family transcriptional regulator
MSAAPEPAEVAAALQVSIGLFMRRLRQAPVQGDLAVPEMSALARLDRGGPATASALARAEQITPQAMGATIAELTRRGLVDRQPDPADGRRTVLSPTEAGRQVVHSKRSARTQQLAKALTDGFTPGELETLLAAAPLIERLGKSIG